MSLWEQLKTAVPGAVCGNLLSPNQTRMNNIVKSRYVSGGWKGMPYFLHKM